tara:strand:+ start:266 stop:2707 length:2442 start_codon:yes stop_codon:yes gene_type:complete
MIKKITNLINSSYVLLIAFLILIFSNLLFNKAEATPTFVDSFIIDSGERSPMGLAFNNDGTKMFVLGDDGNDVSEYSLTTGFDVLAYPLAVNFVDSFSIASQDNDPMGLAFNNDGTKMFVVGNYGNDVNEYTLTTGFDVSSASFVDSFNVNSQDSDPRGLAFNNDGTKMFVVGARGYDINEYNLFTGFDLSSAYFVDSFDVYNQEKFPQSLTFNNDGTKMFVIGSAGGEVHEYTLTTGFDVSSASFVDSFNVNSQDTYPTDITFNNDGTKMFVLGLRGYDVNEYTLSSAYTLFDSTNPTLSSSTPTDNATDVAIDSNIVLNFSESVDVESGNITIKKTSDNSVIETIDITSSNVTGTGSSQITINPSNNLDKGVEYYILIAATAFDDSAGNSYAGVSSTTALSFTTIFSDPTLDKDITGIINTQTILVNESVNYSIETINNRLSFLRQNRYSNQLSKNNISLQFNDPELSTLVSAVSAQKTNNEKYANSKWSYWTEGTFSIGSIGENNTSSLIELESTGVAFGLDKNIDREQLYGVSFQYLQTDSDIGTAGSSVNMENYNLTLYGTRPYRENFVEGLIGVGFIETDIIRKKDSNSYDSSRSGSQLFGSFSMGKEIETKTLNLIPTGTLNVGFTQLNAFSETGSVALKFDKHNIFYKSGTFGLAFENLKKYSQSNFKPFGSIKYNFDFSNASNSEMNYLSDTATIYNYEPKEITDTSFTSLVGFNYLMQNDINISSKYSLVEGNKSKRSQQINFAISTNKKETDYTLAFDGSARQLLKLNVSKNIIGFNLGFGSEVSLKEDAYNLAKINISRNF